MPRCMSAIYCILIIAKIGIMFLGDSTVRRGVVFSTKHFGRGDVQTSVTIGSYLSKITLGSTGEVKP